MKLCYVLLSPTFGMHQYTADIANRLGNRHSPAVEVHLVTVSGYRAERYCPSIRVHTPLLGQTTGLSAESVRAGALQRVRQTIVGLAPDAIHFTGPHLWNLPLVQALKRRGLPVIHTIHDLVPHKRKGTAALLPLWNGSVLRHADRILVHAEQYRNRLLGRGFPSWKVHYTPLLHLFLSYEGTHRADQLARDPLTAVTRHPPPATPHSFLFFARLRKYKGIELLLQAWQRVQDSAATKQPPCKLILAGSGALHELWPGTLPPNVEVQNGWIMDEEALALFRRSALLLLPYTAATQSALVGAAYYFGKPVLATRSGALPEYVVDGQTGYLVAPGDVDALARALQQALASPERLWRMGRNGRRWYEAARVREWEGLQRLYSLP